MNQFTPPPGARILAGPAPTLLPADGPDAAVRKILEAVPASSPVRAMQSPIDQAVREHPDSSLGWALLAEAALAESSYAGSAPAVTDPAEPDTSGETISNALSGEVRAYAFARTGYHRGLDALRRAGWRGQGPIPVNHAANQGFLRALLALSEAATRIGETSEAERCERFLADSGTNAADVAALR